MNYKYFSPEGTNYYLGFFRDSKNIENFLSVLENTETDAGTRVDIADALCLVDSENVIDSLSRICMNSMECLSVLDSCGESLGIIWARRGKLGDLTEFDKSARDICLSTFKFYLEGSRVSG